jgi:hypothetical protein
LLLMVKDNGPPLQTNGHASDGQEAGLQKGETLKPADPVTIDFAAGDPAPGSPATASPPTASPPTASPSTPGSTTDTKATGTQATGTHATGTQATDSQQIGRQPPAAESKPAPSGKLLRGPTPRSCHAEWSAAAGRRDPVEIVIESSIDRVAHLLPIRYGRMQ